MMQVPKHLLSAEILRQIALEFVSREGTDYGHSNWDMDTKVDQVLRQIDAGEVVIAYDDTTQSCNLVKRKDADKEQERLEALALEAEEEQHWERDS